MEDIETLFQTYKNDVYRLALSYTGSTEEAEDVCQTVFLKAMAASVQPGKERAWLMQVTANQCRNLLRSAWWKRTEPLEQELPAVEPQYSDLFQEVMALPPKYRVVIYLRYYEECSTKEMSSLLHISQSAVTTRLSRAREMLRPMLEEELL